jgi:hypothetical protein
MPTRWRMPPDSSWGYRIAKSESRIICSSSAVRAAPASGGMLRAFMLKATLRSTVIQGNSPWSWNTMLVLSDGPSSSTPPTQIVPTVGASRPAISCSNVDLPQPESPRRQTNSPSAAVRSMPRSASTEAALLA